MKIIVLIAILLTIPLFAKVNRMTILDFDNNSGVRKYNSLGKGLADMLTTDLTYAKGLKIVEREKLRAIMKEMRLSKSKYISRKNALKLGRGLSANWLLKGSFTTMKGKMRIDVNIIDVQTGEVVESATVEGWTQKFFSLERRLIRKIIKAIHTKELRLTYNPKDDKKEVKDFKAVINYSKGIDLYDKGEFKESEKAFKKALKFDNNFNYSDKYLDALGARLKKYKQTDILRKEYLKNKKIKDFMDNYKILKKDEMKFITSFSNIITALMSDNKYSSVLGLIDYMKKDPPKFYKSPKYIKTFSVIIDYYELSALKWLKREQEFLKKGEVFINKYPKNDNQRNSIIEWMEDVVKHRKELPKKKKKYKKESRKIKRKLKKNIKYRKHQINTQIKYNKDAQRDKELKKELEELPMKLEKKMKMDLLGKAIRYEQYKEANIISKELLKMKNLTDYDKLIIYKYILENYDNKGQYSKALKYYNSIKKYLKSEKYKSKYIESKEYLKKLKKFKDANYDDEIEKLEDKIDSDDLSRAKQKELKNKKNKLKKEKSKLKRYLDKIKRDYDNIEKYIGYIKRDIKRDIKRMSK